MPLRHWINIKNRDGGAIFFNDPIFELFVAKQAIGELFVAKQAIGVNGGVNIRQRRPFLFVRVIWKGVR